MSEEIKVTITEQIEKINLTITESPKILVNVLNVATVDPSVANARNTAEAAAESASTSAEVALTVLQQAQDIADTLPTMVGDEVTTQLGALTTDNLGEGANNLYFTEQRTVAVIGNLSTDNMAEGAQNLYFTNERAQTALADTTSRVGAIESILSSQFALGDTSLDGSWRLFVDEDSALLIQRRESGAWVNKQKLGGS